MYIWKNRVIRSVCVCVKAELTFCCTCTMYIYVYTQNQKEKISPIEAFREEGTELNATALWISAWIFYSSHPKRSTEQCLNLWKGLEETWNENRANLCVCECVCVCVWVCVCAFRYIKNIGRFDVWSNLKPKPRIWKPLAGTVVFFC